MNANQAASRRSEILTAFEGYREVLDEHNDRRERIIKANRDVTNLSKKLIFQLHRIAQEEITPEGRAKAISKSEAKFADVRALYAKLQGDLVGERGWKYARSVSGGLQELIEALSLRHYLLHGEMISLAQVQQFVTSDSGTKYLELSNADYLLGVSDLTGELMRLAISTVTRPGGRDRALHSSQFVRKCVSALYAIRVREYEHGEQRAFDEVVGRFAYPFERPQISSDMDVDPV